jgi:hypothetical protein
MIMSNACRSDWPDRSHVSETQHPRPLDLSNPVAAATGRGQQHPHKDWDSFCRPGIGSGMGAEMRLQAPSDTARSGLASSLVGL